MNIHRTKTIPRFYSQGPTSVDDMARRLAAISMTAEERLIEETLISGAMPGDFRIVLVFRHPKGILWPIIQ